MCTLSHGVLLYVGYVCVHLRVTLIVHISTSHTYHHLFTHTHLIHHPHTPPSHTTVHLHHYLMYTYTHTHYYNAPSAHHSVNTSPTPDLCTYAHTIYIIHINTCTQSTNISTKTSIRELPTSMTLYFMLHITRACFLFTALD